MAVEEAAAGAAEAGIAGSGSYQDDSTDGHFADRLIRRSRILGHPLCVGLDPHLELLPELFYSRPRAPLDPRACQGVESFLVAVVDRVAERVAAVKPQMAFFERLGWRGLRLLGNVMSHARARGLLVILDAKRGDIGSTAQAYADAYLGQEPALPADAMTLNPYLGRDTLAPFVTAALAHGRGLFVLAKTSNPGAGDYQDREIAGCGRSLAHHVAASLGETCEKLKGPETGYSALGVVVGATWSGESERVRELLPSALFLVPGYGAQGGAARDAVRGFVPGPDGRLEGGIVNSSRGILFPPGAAHAGAAAWERAIDEALDHAVGELGEAVAAR